MKRIGIFLIISVMLFCLTGCTNSKVEDAKKDLEDSYNKYGSVEKETVDTLVNKFNKEIENNSSLNKASNDYLTEYNNQYWYGLVNGVSLVVVPLKYTGDKSTDIVDYMIIYVDKTSEYEVDALTYSKYLVKANYSDIEDTEINELLESAKNESVSGKSAYNGKGISVGYLDKSDYYQYQVLRFYK